MNWSMHSWMLYSFKQGVTSAGVSFRDGETGEDSSRRSFFLCQAAVGYPISTQTACSGHTLLPCRCTRISVEERAAFFHTVWLLAPIAEREKAWAECFIYFLTTRQTVYPFDHALRLDHRITGSLQLLFLKISFTGYILSLIVVGVLLTVTLRNRFN